MKNVLLITSIYPRLDSDDNEGTPVCHYFARDWVKLGYRVIVVHTQSVYPFFFYWLAKLFRSVIAAKTGAVVYTYRDRGTTRYEKDGVIVYRVSVFKFVPHGKYSDWTMAKLKREIVDILKENGVVPDVAVGHFPNPQLELLSCLKKKYGVRTCYIDHGACDQIWTIYARSYENLFRDIDIFGFRSKPIQERFEEMYGKREKTFLCYSGVPENYIQPVERVYTGVLRKFCFVGSLYKLKRVKDIVSALDKVYPNKDFTLDIVGEGQERGDLEKKVRDLSLESVVYFHGRLPREKVQGIMKEAECFVMVSAPEAFGLVYLEAMGKGLITIGTRDQGIDGVIVDGYNGFLCDAGNVEELAGIINKINALTPAERQAISFRAIQTVSEFTDVKAAQKYMDAVIKF